MKSAYFKVIMDEQSITNTYRKLYEARKGLWQASEFTLQRRAELEQERAARIAAGEIMGKNADERESRARDLLASFYAAVVDAELKERRAKLDYDLVKIEVDRIDTILRLLTVKK